MQDPTLDCSQSDPLETINGVKFTPRELDIISCILSGRTSKTVASFLSISSKTVEHHIRNMMLKLGCNSQESIRDFIEKSGKFNLIRNHYQHLLIQATFRQHLREIFVIIHNQAPRCCLYYSPKQQVLLPLIREIEEHLKLAGIKVVLNQGDGNQFLTMEEESHIDKVIYVVSEAVIEKFHTHESEISGIMQYALQNFGFLTFLSLDKSPLDIPQEFSEVGCITFSNQETYYQSIFEVLKKLVPDLNLDKIVSKFDEHYKLIHSGSIQESSKTEGALKGFTKNVIPILGISLKNSKQRLMFIFILSVSILCLMFFVFKRSTIGEPTQTQNEQETSVRSDLMIPAENALLKRAHLMAQIEEKFKNSQGIQTIVFVGIGGAGKTTLARQYLRSQKPPIVWEIRAETKESLVISFEQLAYAVSKTPEEKGELDSIQKLEDSRERTKRVLFFVKKKLKQQNGWCLLFDNVESFADIKEFYPLDTETWGTGKIIMTTRDRNIKNNSYINPHNVIDIEELSDKEKFTLLTGIIYENNSQEMSSSQKEKIETFLKEIPSFPLDVSTAAYYIKDTKISYEDYLERLKISSMNFEKAQETLLKETSDYTKTRYGIIILTLKNLIGENQDFKELLLFISLLDSQDIPSDLLMAYKESAVVEQFIHDLRKQSLITTKVFNIDQSIPTFSIHRSTQEICLNYLKNTLNPADYDKNLLTCTKTLATCMDDTLNKYYYPKMRLLVKHGELFLSHGKILDNINKKNISNTIELLINMGTAYRYLGDYTQSKDLSNIGYQICKEHLGNNHIKTAEVLGNLGISYEFIGDYVTSINFYKRAILIYNKHYGEDHVETAWLLVSLGHAYENVGQFIEAKQVYEKSLSTFRQHYTEDDEKISMTLAHLGSVYRSLGDYKKAKNLLEQSLIIHQNLNNESHVKRGWILVHLGSVYKSLGDYKKAKFLLEQSLAIYKEHYGETHMMTGWALVHLGNVYRRLGYFEQAKSFLEQGWTAYKTCYSESSSEIAWVLIHLGNTYRCLGDYEKARTLLEKGLDIYKNNFDKDHVLIGWALIKVGEAYLGLGNYEKARMSFEESFKIYETHYGLNHVNFAEIFLSLGQSYFLTNQMEKAESLMNQSLQVFTANNHPEAYSALEALGGLNVTKATTEKDTEKSKTFKNQAISYLKQATETVNTHFPKDSPHVTRIESKLKEIV